uniref:Arginine/serine-rich splicing factor n=1 Tax=Rhizophora mucronata TaxID=61149 RepID=A0A2P2M7V6_RHIMU
MASFSTTITLVLPVPSLAISSPMPINATIKAASRSWGRTSAHIFPRTTRHPLCELHNDTTSINLLTI